MNRLYDFNQEQVYKFNNLFFITYKNQIILEKLKKNTNSENESFITNFCRIT